MTTVLFWDIDGTLLTTEKAGLFALEDATQEVLGTSVDWRRVETAGMSDRRIVTNMMKIAGFDADDEKIDRILQLYGSYLPRSLPRKQGYVFPGVKEILQTLQERDDVVSLLLTGNIQAGAEAKLSHYGLKEYFIGGGFSDKSVDRKDIARIALEVAKDKVQDIDMEKIYVIGDTPHDVECAKAIDVKAIAVATGSYSVEQLQEYQPWWLIPTLPEPHIFLSKIDLT